MVLVTTKSILLIQCISITALSDLIGNCLLNLQTILTPNLPSDPTVETMRNYLVYIQIFNTDDDGSAPLSLQEQTFLAQKQLQKYNLQKLLKSEAVGTILLFYYFLKYSIA